MIATFTKRHTMPRVEERLNSEHKKKLCHFVSNTATAYEQWIDIRDYSLVPSRPIHVKVIRCSS